MDNPCPNCGKELRDDAKFCDNCGAPVGAAPAAAPAAPAAPAATGSVNWTAILLVVIVLGLLGWLLFGKSGGGNGAGANSGGATADNPHGGMDQGVGMEDVTNQIADAKASLDQNPLDTKALATLYQMYGMIGRQNQLTPYVEAALAELDKNKDSLGPEKTEELLRGIVTAALGGNDMQGGLLALERYVEIDPDNVQTLAMLGNLNYDLGNHDDAIKWYDQYLEKADKAEEGNSYWNAKADRASMYLERYKKNSDDADLQMALTELKEITVEQPSHWGAWYNLGQTYLQTGDNELAEAAFEQAKALAVGPMQVWQAESELAKMRGEEPPPMPGGESNPHGGMDMGGAGGMGSAEGMPNPHGGDMGSGGGAANPHGGMGGA